MILRSQAAPADSRPGGPQVRSRWACGGSALFAIAQGVLSWWSIPNYLPVSMISIAILLILVFLCTWGAPRPWQETTIVTIALGAMVLGIQLFYPFLFSLDLTLSLFMLATFALILGLAIVVTVRFSFLSPVGLLLAGLAEWAAFAKIRSEPVWLWIAVAGMSLLIVILSYLLVEVRAERSRILSLLDERDELNRRLAESAAQLVEKRQQETLSMIGASVVHEINNPLNYLQGNLGFLRYQVEQILASESPEQQQQSPGQREELTEILDSFETGVRTITDVVKSIREIFRGNLSRSEDIGLARVVQSSLRAAEVLEVRGIETVNEVDPTITVHCNPTDVYTVLVNLFRNSLDALGESGRIRIVSELVGVRVRVVVEDTGSGVNPEHMSQIFEPHFSTKRDHGGLGIGLTLCRAIVERYNGQIAIESRRLGPTRVSFDLPVSQEVEAARPGKRSTRA